MGFWRSTVLALTAFLYAAMLLAVFVPVYAIFLLWLRSDVYRPGKRRSGPQRAPARSCGLATWGTATYASANSPSRSLPIRVRGQLTRFAPTNVR